jgi:hypothetical protein
MRLTLPFKNNVPKGKDAVSKELGELQQGPNRRMIDAMLATIGDDEKTAKVREILEGFDSWAARYAKVADGDPNGNGISPMSHDRFIDRMVDDTTENLSAIEKSVVDERVVPISSLETGVSLKIPQGMVSDPQMIVTGVLGKDFAFFVNPEGSIQVFELKDWFDRADFNNENQLYLELVDRVKEYQASVVTCLHLFPVDVSKNLDRVQTTEELDKRLTDIGVYGVRHLEAAAVYVESRGSTLRRELDSTYAHSLIQAAQRENYRHLHEKLENALAYAEAKRIELSRKGLDTGPQLETLRKFRRILDETDKRVTRETSATKKALHAVRKALDLVTYKNLMTYLLATGVVIAAYSILAAVGIIEVSSGGFMLLKEALSFTLLANLLLIGIGVVKVGLETVEGARKAYWSWRESRIVESEARNNPVGIGGAAPRITTPHLFRATYLSPLRDKLTGLFLILSGRAPQKAPTVEEALGTITGNEPARDDGQP